MISRSCGLLLPLLFLALTACGLADFARLGGPPVETIAAERPGPSPSEQTAALRNEIHRKLETEEYRSALNLLRKENKGIPEASLAEEYGRAINGLLGQAERYRETGLPEKAGELLRSAHDGYPKTEAAAEYVNATPAEILARIEECAGELMERGLVAYRAGDLDEAIRMWKTIRAFSPRHQASRKALETAEVQRANLEKVGINN